MQNTWKNVSFALSAMIVGSLVTTVVLSLPNALQRGAVAQNNAITQNNTVASGTNTQLAVDRHDLTHAESLSNAFRNVAEVIRPCVVSISTLQTELIRRNVPQGIPPQYQRLFGAPVEELERSGMGSGVIVSTDGYILTNNHVIEDADELTVELHDGRKFRAAWSEQIPKPI